MKTLSGLTLLGGNIADGPVDLRIENGRIAAITPSAALPHRRLLAMPALVNAHDHTRALSTTSFGLGDKPLESWLPGQGKMPAVDPYLAALVAFGHAARAGAGTVMAHYTRLHGPMSPMEEIGEVARAAKEVGVRVAFALYMRDRNPLVYGPADPVLANLSPSARRTVEQQFLAPQPTAEEQVKRVEDIAKAYETPMFQVQFGPNGMQWCSDELLTRIAESSASTGRRVHMHLLETQYQRQFVDAQYPEGVLPHLKRIGLLSERLTLAHCVYARADELDLIAASGAVMVTNPSSNLHLQSGIAPIGEAIRRGARVAVGVDASALDEDDDVIREMRLAHFLHGGFGFERTISRFDWVLKTVKDGRFATDAPGDGALQVGSVADFLVLDLDRLDADAITAVEPIDLLFGRGSQAHIVHLIVAGEDIVQNGKIITLDLAASEARVRQLYRERMPGREPFLSAWRELEPRIRDFYAGTLGCC